MQEKNRAIVVMENQEYNGYRPFFFLNAFFFDCRHSLMDVSYDIIRKLTITVKDFLFIASHIYIYINLVLTNQYVVCVYEKINGFVSGCKPIIDCTLKGK